MLYSRILSLMFLFRQGLAACNAVTDDLVLDGENFYRQVVSSPFKGVSGDVVLDERTGSRLGNSTSYSMINLVEGTNETFVLDPVLSRVYRGGNWTEISPFRFNDGTTEWPTAPSYYSLWQDSSQPDLVYLDASIIVFAAIFCTLSIALAVACAWWTWCKRDTRIVRASQPLFLLIICFGTFILGRLH